MSAKEAWGYAPDESLSIPDLLVEKYQGIRPAVGYPSLPDQSVNFLLDELLGMKQIGITLTEHGAMHPHSSVCGMMLAHPASRYFAVGKIGEDQLEDYARRRGMPIGEYAEVSGRKFRKRIIMLIIRYIEKGVTQTTQIKQIFTDNFVHHEFLICGHLFNLCHLCAIKNNPF